MMAGGNIIKGFGELVEALKGFRSLGRDVKAKAIASLKSFLKAGKAVELAKEFRGIAVPEVVEIFKGLEAREAAQILAHSKTNQGMRVLQALEEAGAAGKSSKAAILRELTATNSAKADDLSRALDAAKDLQVSRLLNADNAMGIAHNNGEVVRAVRVGKVLTEAEKAAKATSDAEKLISHLEGRWYYGKRVLDRLYRGKDVGWQDLIRQLAKDKPDVVRELAARVDSPMLSERVGLTRNLATHLGEAYKNPVGRAWQEAWGVANKHPVLTGAGVYGAWQLKGNIPGAIRSTVGAGKDILVGGKDLIADTINPPHMTLDDAVEQKLIIKEQKDKIFEELKKAGIADERKYWALLEFHESRNLQPSESIDVTKPGVMVALIKHAKGLEAAWAKEQSQRNQAKHNITNPYANVHGGDAGNTGDLLNTILDFKKSGGYWTLGLLGGGGLLAFVGGMPVVGAVVAGLALFAKPILGQLRKLVQGGGGDDLEIPDAGSGQPRTNGGAAPGVASSQLLQNQSTDPQPQFTPPVKQKSPVAGTQPAPTR